METVAVGPEPVAVVPVLRPSVVRLVPPLPGVTVVSVERTPLEAVELLPVPDVLCISGSGTPALFVVRNLVVVVDSTRSVVWIGEMTTVCEVEILVGVLLIAF